MLHILELYIYINILYVCIQYTQTIHIANCHIIYLLPYSQLHYISILISTNKYYLLSFLIAFASAEILFMFYTGIKRFLCDIVSFLILVLQLQLVFICKLHWRFSHFSSDSYNTHVICSHPVKSSIHIKMLHQSVFIIYMRCTSLYFHINLMMEKACC